MSRTVLVTGATGLAGANVCKLLVERGDTVRALARGSADTGPLSALGVQVVTGDITDPDAVLRAARGSDAAVHCAALLGGASQDPADFEAVNVGGTRNVLDAAEAVDMGRVVALSTGTFFDTAGGLDREDAPVAEAPSQDPYTLTKMAAFLDAMSRAARGRDVVSAHPGAIYGPSPVASNALGVTSFNRVLLSAARGRIERYLAFPLSWVYAEDVARGCLLALDKGVAGERYVLGGRPEDMTSVAGACNRLSEVAGLDHRVVDVEPSGDPELLEVFGPTLMAIAERAARQPPERRRLEGSKTYQRLRYSPIGLDEGLGHTYEWFRALGKVDAA
ncbi:MAG: NAD-dependent epimerase/dehydratase family protein [Acidimicrobiales bacterium]